MSKQLIVAGFHRSGTSLVCQLLSRAGLFLGYDLLGADASNPHGHFEDLEILNLHKQILEDNGKTWQVAEPFSPDITDQRRRWMEQIVERRDGDHRLWGFKDPRVCLLLAAWKSLLPDARVLVVYRHPADTAHSLDKRHSTALFLNKRDREMHLRFWEEPDLALRMWLVHNEALVAFARAHPEDALAVSIDMVQGGFPVVGAMERRWGLGLDEVAASEVFDPSVTGRRVDKQAVSDEGLIERIEAVWGELEHLGDQTEQMMGEEPKRRRLSRDDFYTPAGPDAPRMENELLTLGMRFLKARLAESEYSRAFPEEDIEAGAFELKRGLEAVRKEETEGPPRAAALEAGVAEVEDLRRLISSANEQFAIKHRRLANTRRRLVDRDQQLADLQRQLSAVSVDRTQQARELESLGRWVKKLDLASSALLNSWRWKVGNAFGNAFGEVWRRILLQPRVPMAWDQLREIDEELRIHYERVEQDKSVRDERQPGAAESTKPPRPPTPLPSAAPEPRRFGSPEYVLDALRSSQPVTIVVPIYNAYDYVNKFLPSMIRNTTSSPARLLLIDDASPDPRIPPLLADYEALENVSVLTNDENLGFSATINRGFAESVDDDVVIINSDTEVTPRWLENLKLAAHADPRTATVTPVSDKAGAFSVPHLGIDNDLPEGLDKDGVGRLVTHHSGQVYPQTPTGNGYCMYIKRAALEEVGLFDSDRFPRGYAQENDLCMRANKVGWNHVVDDTTIIFHERTASFGVEKKELLEAARKTLDELHPEYSRLARAFAASEDMERVATNVETAYESVEVGRPRVKPRVKPRVLYVIHDAIGGTPHTNLDLMSALADRYSPYLLVPGTLGLKLFRYEPEGLVLVEERSLERKWESTEFSRPDYRAIVFDLLVSYRFEMVHIRHLLGHTFDLPEVAARLGVPVVLSFHDFYFSCPTIQLIDDNGKYCGGICTPGTGRQCRLPRWRRKELPVLKHAWLGTWRQQVEKMFEHVDAFVTTSVAAKEVYLRSLPTLHNRRFEIIEHGRDLDQQRLAVVPDAEDGPVRILIPGIIGSHKGAGFIRALEQEDSENRLEFHFLGKVAHEFSDLEGVHHGAYERDEFNKRVEEIKPSFIGIFSIWPETYCHTLTEAWGAGVPVLASDIGTIKERVNAHGGGWLLDHEDPKGSYERILEIVEEPAAYGRELERADLGGIRTTREMSDDYEQLYKTVLSERRQFKPSGRVSALS